MKQINKGSEPGDFKKWKQDDKMAKRPNWNRVPKQERESVHRSLLYEQGHICCYCQSDITICNSHIEHFRPQKKYREFQLDYNNLHCSCQKDPIRGEPRHCGHKKGNWYDESLLVSPMAKDCEDKFKFYGDGQILPNSGDAAATVTIRKLGLNIPKLQARRAAAVEAVLEMDLPDSEIRSLVTERDANGQFIAYCISIKQVLLD